MELTIRIPDHTAAIFDYLQKGLFISSNSTNEDVRDLYDIIDDDFEALSIYFAQIGYTLERGNEYFYFLVQNLVLHWNKRFCVPITGLMFSTYLKHTMKLSDRAIVFSRNRYWWKPTSTSCCRTSWTGYVNISPIKMYAKRCSII